MATMKQIALIKELLDELGWDRGDVASNIGDQFYEYEELDVDAASGLISELIEEKQTMYAEMRGDYRV